MRGLERSFAGGEVGPTFWGRIDDVKYQTGLATCRNFVCMPQGPVENRAGTQFVREVKNSAVATRAIGFTYSTSQTMVIELGAGYFRFHTAGATLLYSAPAAYSGATNYAVGDMASSGGVNYYCILATIANAPPNATYWYAMPSVAPLIYEIPNPYAAADLMDIHYVQSADVLTLVHQNYPPMELRRVSATKWTLTVVAFASTLAAPTATAAAATGGTGITYNYGVTSVGAIGVDESVLSSIGTCNGNVFVTGAYNTVTWTAAAGVSRYNVYKFSGGNYGYVGQTTSLSFIDNNIAADISRTPPINTNPFPSAGNYPGAVSYFEQRRCFAGSINAPQNVWTSKSGTEANMNYSLPMRDDDSIQFRVAAREANTIRHFVPLNDLIILTSAAEWRVTSTGDAITPGSVGVKPQSYIGSSNVAPIMVNNTLLFFAARGGHVREMAYQYQVGGYVTGDLCLRAPHLFDTFSIVDAGYVKAPYPVVWCVSSTGKLLGMTYVPEQQIGAWHQHDTDGIFESVTVVAEGQEDVPYFIVKRTINGATKRYVERLHTRVFVNPQDAFFVDAGLTYAGAPATVISGLGHLEAKTVSVLGDGAVMPPCLVTGGQITLQQAVSTAQIGLPITADVQTLPETQDMPGLGQGHPKNVNSVWLRVVRSGGISIGPTTDKLTPYHARTTETYGSAPALKTDEIQVVVQPSWNPGGQIWVRQTDPLPLTIASISTDADYGE